jgi:cell fate (sporulation/competence/biofilm development) regulator YlbF (YheA/YmcA/DUF963 family)
MLDDKALDLGRQIGQSPEYQALRRAETALRADQDAVSRLEKIQELARQVDAAISRGELPTRRPPSSTRPRFVSSK